MLSILIIITSLPKGYITSEKEYFYQDDLNICDVFKTCSYSQSLRWKLKVFLVSIVLWLTLNFKFSFYWCVGICMLCQPQLACTCMGKLCLALAPFYHCIFLSSLYFIFNFLFLIKSQQSKRDGILK